MALPLPAASPLLTLLLWPLLGDSPCPVRVKAVWTENNNKGQLAMNQTNRKFPLEISATRTSGQPSCDTSSSNFTLRPELIKNSLHSKTLKYEIRAKK